MRRTIGARAVGDAWNDGLALQVDDLGVRSTLTPDVSVGADSIDLVACDRHCFHPFVTRASRIDVSIQ